MLVVNLYLEIKQRERVDIEISTASRRSRLRRSLLDHLLLLLRGVAARELRPVRDFLLRWLADWRKARTLVLSAERTGQVLREVLHDVLRALVLRRCVLRE